jgi:endonuclease/exonuclease/phosphatase family metal-dependent hydrolase
MAQLTLLTFNAFGILSWDTMFRLIALVDELNRIEPDIVCLQEIHQHYFERRILRSLLHYPAAVSEPRRYRPKGGLLTIAKAPFVSTQFILYREQGPWYTLHLMDRLLKKGMLVTRHQYAGLPVVVINTHLIANYAANYAKADAAARVQQVQQAQLHQLAELARSQPHDALVVVMGDFNIPRHSWLYEDFVDRSGLRDTLSGDTRPTYRPLPGIPARYALPIDFAFVRQPAGVEVSLTSRLILDERRHLLGGYSGYLSDHLGILTTATWPDPRPEPGDPTS